MGTNSIEDSWDLLTNRLGWTHVITSKTLHFLCRALGFNQDPPVPIDNNVILKYVWPGFRIGIPSGQRPRDWEGNDFAAYCTYMTAIIEWARVRNWTTTEVETTIFVENDPVEEKMSTQGARTMPDPPHGYGRMSPAERAMWPRLAPLFDNGFCEPSDALYLEQLVSIYTLWKQAEQGIHEAAADQRGLYISLATDMEEQLVEWVREMHHGKPDFSIAEFEALLLPE